MKNKILRLVALLLILATVCSLLMMAAYASSEEDGSEDEESVNSTVTHYNGIEIPEEHRDKYFVAFCEGVCIGSSDKFGGGTSATSIIGIALGADYTKAGKNVDIVLLKDYNAPNTDYHDNLAQCQATITVDLNGNTFYADRSLFRLTPKANSVTTNVILKNGNVVLGNNPLVTLYSYTYPEKLFTFTCENVNISVADTSTLTSLIVGYNKKKDNNANFELNFNDCVFDVRNAGNHITLFEANDPTGTYPTPMTIKYSVEDCSIMSNSPDSYTVWGTFNDNSSYTEKNLVRENKIRIYEEDFDDVEGKVTLDAGNNTFGPAKGWIYSQKSTNGEAYIENGRLYFSGSELDVLYRDGGQTWGNYTLEADFCYTDESKSWLGMLYNVQSDTKFQKGGIGMGKTYSLNGYDGKWTNSVSGVNRGFSLAEDVVFGKGTPFRLKIAVYNKTASLYYAMLDENGSMQTDYIHLVTIDNIPADAQTGSIGFVTSSDGLASFWVDNIECYSSSMESYSENFDSYGDVTFEADADNDSIGVYFDRSDSLENGGAEIKDGALHLSGGGKDFDAIFFNMGKNWTNYVLESDLTFVSESNNDGWGGLLFRATDKDNFWKGAINPVGTGSLNCQLGGSWYKNTNTSEDYSEGALEYGETVRVRIIVNEKVAELYAAKYAEGVLGEWVHVMTTVSEDKFAAAHMQGTIGLIVGGSSNSKEKHIYVDNITVSRIEGADRLVTEPNAATIYEPETGIVNPPVVVERLTDSLPATEGERAAVVIADLDANLNIIDKDGTALMSAEDFIDTYRRVLIPAFVIDSEAEADTLASLINEKTLIDCYVVADSANAALVTRVRCANSTASLTTGALIFDDLNSLSVRKSARALVADSMSYVAISKAPISDEAAFYFAARQIAVWSFADSAAEVYRGIANGYHGIVSTDSSIVYDVYESITEPTVSGETVVIAHRGAKEQAETPYPENTLMGIRAAKEIWGADAIEIDFGLTKDEYIVLMHDTTVDRTTDGTGNVSSFTLEEIKALTVDYIAGKETTVPTLDEVLLLAKEIDVVLYCHIKDKTDANLAAFCHLVEKYDCADRVLLFSAAFEQYNPTTDRVYTGTGYNLTDAPVMIDGIQFTAANQKILSGYTSYLDGVVAMRECLNKYNYQPLFYKYNNQGDMWGAETFYYQLSARGFINTHSTTGEADMDSTALTESGCAGWLTNYPHHCDDWHYGIDTSSEKLTLKLGEVINLSKMLKLTMGTVSVDCGLTQVDGNTLVSIEDGYTLNEPGTVTVVYYAIRTTDSGSTYRVYSEPVKIAFVSESVTDFTPKTSITLGSELVYNIYVPVSDILKSFTVDGKTYANAKIVTLDDGNQYYHIAVPMVASEAARNVVLKAIITIDGKDYNGTFTMSIPKYSQKVLVSDANATEKTLVKDVSEDGVYANYRYVRPAGETEYMFYRSTAEGANVSAGKAYLQIPLEWLPLSPMESVQLRFDDGETTGIEEVEGDGKSESSIIYDMSGRVVINPVKGIYIVNGKKIVIK